MKPGRTLDALISEKVMGITPEFETRELIDGTGRKIGSVELPGGPAPYSTDIAAAFEVVEALRAKGFTFVLGDFESRGSIPMKPTAEIRAMFGRTGYRVEMIPGDSATHAICLAALKAVGHGS